MGRPKGEGSTRYMARFFIVMFTFALIIGAAASVAAPVVSAFSGSGSGTVDDPYIITNDNQLQAMKNNLTAYYALGNDIDATATQTWNDNGTGGYYGFELIGYYDVENKIAYPFTGSFDGRGYKISNLYINRPSTSYIGLFGYVGSGGVVKNVGMENESVSGHYHVGGLVGHNGGTVSNSYSTGLVNGGSYVGGLVGRNYLGTVSYSYSTDSVSGSYCVGGLVGWNDGGTVSYSYSTGTVSGGKDICVGGLVGINHGTVSNCYSTGTVSGGNYYVGGLVGNNGGIVSNSYSTGTVSGVQGVQFVGGLVGNNGGIVSNSYSTGTVSGVQYVGGLVGYNWGGTVSYSYSTGTVSGSYHVGGLVGQNNKTVSNSFWDINTSGQATSDGGTGKTTENMKIVRTFTDNTWSVGLTVPWDFVGNPYYDENNENIWNINPAINDGYPFLTVFDTTAPPIPTLIAPANGAVISDNTPTFVWTSVSDPSGVTYQIQIDNDADFSSSVYNAISIPDNTAYRLPLENALALGKYYWHVRATDGVGNIGDWSVTWNFTVVPVGAIGVLLMPLLMLLPFALMLRRQNRRYRY